MTINYEALAKKAPGKRGRKPKLREFSFDGPKPDAALMAPATPAHLSTLPIPEGVKRYYLRVPRERAKQAKDAGCQWDASVNRWYVDNPILSDFTAWHPTLSARADTQHAKRPAIEGQSQQRPTQVGDRAQSPAML